MTASPTLRRGAVSALDIVGRLTERDRFLCRVLWEHRLLTTDQVVDLCFTSLTSAQHRLVALWRLGVLERFLPLRPTGSASWRASAVSIPCAPRCSTTGWWPSPPGSAWPTPWE